MGFIKWLLGKSKEKQKEDERNRIEADRFRKWEEQIDKINRRLDDIAPKTNLRIIRSNDTVTVIIPPNVEIVKVGCTDAMFERLRNCDCEEDVNRVLFSDSKLKEDNDARRSIEKKKETLQTIDYLVESGEFERVDNAVYMKGIPVSVPAVLIDKFTVFIKEVFDKSKSGKFDIQYLEDKYLGLKRFWMWCSLNPDHKVREDLFSFLKNHDLEVNKNGFFFTYRRVVTKKEASKESIEFNTFISTEYLKIRTKWKKNPKNYYVINTTKGYAISKAEIHSSVGNLANLYENLNTTEQVFTDNHTKTFDIRIGKEVRIDRKLCDSNGNRDCSKGLHSGNKNFGYEGFGDTAILCLINPADVVSVPTYNVNKMRSCAYFPVAILDMKEATTFLTKAEVLDLCDTYFVDEVNKLEALVANNQPIESIKHEFINESSLKTIIVELTKMKQLLASRVKKV